MHVYANPARFLHLARPLTFWVLLARGIGRRCGYWLWIIPMPPADSVDG